MTISYTSLWFGKPSARAMEMMYLERKGFCIIVGVVLSHQLQARCLSRIDYPELPTDSAITDLDVKCQGNDGEQKHE